MSNHLPLDKMDTMVEFSTKKSAILQNYGFLLDPEKGFESFENNHFYGDYITSKKSIFNDL